MFQAQLLGHASPTLRVGLVEVDQLAHNGSRGHALHGLGQVAEELLLLAGVHQPKGSAWLFLVVRPAAGIIAVSTAGDLGRRF